MNRIKLWNILLILTTTFYYSGFVAGLTLSPCQSRFIVIETESSNAQVICSGAAATDTITWTYGNGQYMVSIPCDPTGSCGASNAFIASRSSQSNSSTLTFTQLSNEYFRNLYGNMILNCNTQTQAGTVTGETSCNVDVVNAGTVNSADCKLGVNTGSDNWSVTGNCTVTNAYSSRSRYGCQWRQSSSVGGDSINITGTVSNITSPVENDQRDYTCTFSTSVPQQTAVFTYTMTAFPGNVSVMAGSYRVELPSNPKPGCRNDYYREGETLQCTCSVDSPGSPAASVLWSHNTGLGPDLQMVVTAKDNNRVITCQARWGNTVLRQTNYTIQVASSSTTVLPSVPTRHDVTCGHNDVSFSIDLSQFQLRPQTATLSDTRCRLNLNGSHLTGRTALNACGTTIRFSNDTVIFSNTILLRDLANSSGSTSFTIPIECHYNRISDFRLTYLPIVSQILFKEIGDGEFDFRIQQFTDASFATAISASSYPLQVMPSQEIFIQLSLEDVSQNMSVGMEVVSCLASPHSSPLMANQVHQNLIVDGCPANTDVRVIEEKHDSSVSGKPGDYFRFSFKALTFSGVSNSTTGLRYILCRVQLCDDNPGQATSCSTRPRQCPSPSAVHRRRRAASESANLQLSTGPLLLLGQRESEDSAFHTDSPTAVIVLGALTGLATLVAVTAVVAWLRGLRKRRQLGYPILSPDQTEQLGLTATG